MSIEYLFYLGFYLKKIKNTHRDIMSSLYYITSGTKARRSPITPIYGRGITELQLGIAYLHRFD